MSEIVFAKTRWEYQSYIDFWRLVELSKFDICYVDEMDVYDTNKVYIVSPMNGEWRPFIDSKFPNGRVGGAKLVSWNLERPGGSGSIEKYAKDNHDLIGHYADRVVVSDRTLAQRCELDYMPLGIHPDFGMPGSFEDKWFDVIHLSCYSNHRSWLFDTPDKPKAVLNGNIAVAPNGWGVERHRRLQQSKFMLATHQDGFPYIEPIRFALAYAYGLHIISETCLDSYPYTLLPIEDMQDIVKAYNIRAFMEAIRLRRYMLDTFPFRKCAEDYAGRLW